MVLLAFIGDRLGGMILQKLIERSQFRYSRIEKGATKNVDILLIGNSRGLTFYQPAIEKLTGKSTLNISYNGLPMNLARAIVQDQLQKNGTPKVALIDITLCTKSNQELISSFKAYATCSQPIADLLRQQDVKTYRASRVSHLYRYNSEVFQRALFYLNQSDEDWLLDRTITQAMVENAALLEPYQLKVKPQQLVALQKTIWELEEAGTEVHLVVGPYFPTFRLAGLEEYIQQVESACQKEVHDFSNLLSEPAHFGDYQHPNVAGSLLYMEALDQEGLFD